VDNEPTDIVESAPEARGRGWDVADFLALTLVVAPFLLAAAYVAAAIIEEVGGQIPSPSVKAYTLLLATDWSAPYFALLPIAALAIAWWMVRQPDAGGDVRRLLRARSHAAGAVGMLAIIACAAIGCAWGNFFVYNNPAEVPGAELWASEVERLGNAIGTLVLCVAGIAVAFKIWGAVRERLGAEIEELPDLAAEPEGPATEVPVPATDPAPVAAEASLTEPSGTTAEETVPVKRGGARPRTASAAVASRPGSRGRRGVHGAAGSGGDAESAGGRGE